MICGETKAESAALRIRDKNTTSDALRACILCDIGLPNGEANVTMQTLYGYIWKIKILFCYE